MKVMVCTRWKGRVCQCRKKQSRAASKPLQSQWASFTDTGSTFYNHREHLQCYKETDRALQLRTLTSQLAKSATFLELVVLKLKKKKKLVAIIWVSSVTGWNGGGKVQTATFVATWHKGSNLRRGHLSWENAPTRLPCGQACGTFSCLLIGVSGTTPELMWLRKQAR